MADPTKLDYEPFAKGIISEITQSASRLARLSRRLDVADFRGLENGFHQFLEGRASTRMASFSSATLGWQEWWVVR